MKEKKDISTVEGQHNEIEHMMKHPLWHLIQRRGCVLVDIEKEKDSTMKLEGYKHLIDLDEAIIAKLWKDSYE